MFSALLIKFNVSLVMKTSNWKSASLHSKMHSIFFDILGTLLTIPNIKKKVLFFISYCYVNVIYRTRCIATVILLFYQGCSCQTEGERTWRPLLLFIPLRLGLAEMNPIYVPGLKVSMVYNITFLSFTVPVWDSFQLESKASGTGHIAVQFFFFFPHHTGIFVSVNKSFFFFFPEMFQNATVPRSYRREAEPRIIFYRFYGWV